jgi:hypothetical protein
MIKGILEAIGQLVGVNIAQTILNVTVNHQFGQAQNFTRQVESVSEPTFLSFLGGESFRWFQVEIIIQVKVIQLFPVYKQVQHVVALPTDL